jgi:hypothetical protein
MTQQQQLGIRHGDVFKLYQQVLMADQADLCGDASKSVQACSGSLADTMLH